MDIKLIAIIMFFVILVSIQYSLNVILRKMDKIIEILNLLAMKNK